RNRGVRCLQLFEATWSRMAQMESRADTGMRMEIPEGSLISMESLVGSEVWKLGRRLNGAYPRVYTPTR
ncbi:MAG: hypothetical protein ACK5S6_04435, partial [bacterium]